MIVIIDLMGDEEIVIVGGEPDAKEDLRKKERMLREIAERTPQPDLLIVPVTPTKSR